MIEIGHLAENAGRAARPSGRGSGARRATAHLPNPPATGMPARSTLGPACRALAALAAVLVTVVAAGCQAPALSAIAGSECPAAAGKPADSGAGRIAPTHAEPSATSAGRPASEPASALASAAASPPALAPASGGGGAFRAAAASGASAATGNLGAARAAAQRPAAAPSASSGGALPAARDGGASPGASAAAGQPAGAGAASRSAGSVAVDVARDPWTWGEARGFVLRTANYEINTSITDESLLRDLPRLMEAALLNYTSALGDLPKPTRPMRSMIFDKRSEWAAYTKRKLPQEADTYLAIGRGGYTTGGESVLFNLGRTDTFVIAVHEGWHQYTQSVFKDRLPTWLEEGVACWMEGHRFRRDGSELSFIPWRNFERFGALRDAVREERLVPLKDILRGTPQEALGDGKATLLGYYAQVWALVQFLDAGEGGRYRAGLRQVLRDAADGAIVRTLMESEHVPKDAKRPWSLMRGGRWVTVAYFNADLDELSRQYEAFVRKIVADGNGSRIWRGESPLGG